MRLAVLLLVVALGLGLFMPVALGFDPGWEFKDVMAAVLSAIGTCLGALLAFRLQDDAAMRKEDDQRVAALNKALLVATQQINAAQLFARALPQGSPVERAINCVPGEFPPYTNLRYDLASLCFLADHSGDVEQLLHLSIEEERFFATKRAFETRQQFYFEHLRPAVRQAKTRSDGSLTNGLIATEELRRRIDPVIWRDAFSTVEEMDLHVSKLLESLPIVHKSLLALAKRRYPSKRFIGIEVLNPADQKH